MNGVRCLTGSPGHYLPVTLFVLFLFIFLSCSYTLNVLYLLHIYFRSYDMTYPMY